MKNKTGRQPEVEKTVHVYICLIAQQWVQFPFGWVLQAAVALEVTCSQKVVDERLSPNLEPLPSVC